MVRDLFVVMHRKVPRRLIVLLTGILFFASCQKPSTYRLSGMVEATGYPVVAEVGGTIVEIYKAEGEKVVKGEAFARLDAQTYSHTIKQLEAQVAAKNFRLEELVRGARPQEISSARARVNQAKSSVASSIKNLETSQVNLNYAQDKFEKTMELYSQLRATEDEVKDAKYKLDTAKKSMEDSREKVNYAKTQQELAAASFDLVISGTTSETIETAKAELNSVKSQLEGSKSMLEKYTVKIPSDGSLIQKNMSQGEVANVGSTLGTVLDLKDLFVKLYVPQRELTKVSLGQEIALMAYSDQNITVKGKINYISDKAEFTPRNIETDEAKETTVYKIKVKIETKDPRIKPGMTLETTLKLE